MTIMSKSMTATVDKATRKEKYLFTVVGVLTGPGTMEVSIEIPQKAKTITAYHMT